MNGLVGNGQAVVGLVFFPQALQNGHRRLRRGLLHRHRLEPPLQGGVLFNVAAVFVQSGGTDDPDFRAAEGGLEEIGGIHRPLGAAGTYDIVEFVDEQHHVAHPAHLLEGGAHPFLKFPPILGPRQHGGKVDGKDVEAQQLSGHIPCGDPLGQALYHRRFAHAGLTNEDGVVLGPAAEDTDGPGNLFFPAQHRVQPSLPGQGAETAGKLLQDPGPGGFLKYRRPGLLGLLLRLCAAAQTADEGVLQLTGICSCRPEGLGGHSAAFPENPQQQVLGADPSATPAGGFPGGVFNDPPGPGRKALGRGKAGRAHSHQFPQNAADLLRSDLLLLEAAPGGAPLLENAKQQMLAADVTVAQLPGGLPGQPQGAASPGGKLIVAHIAISSVCLLSPGVFPLTEVLHISGLASGFCPCNFKTSCYNEGTNL